MVKKRFVFGLFITLWFCIFSYAGAQESSLSYRDLVRALRFKASSVEQRQAFVQKISDFPSSQALSFLQQLIALEPQPSIVEEARRASLKIQRFLNQEDQVVLDFRYKDKKYVLRKTVFEEEVGGPKYGGNASGFVRWFFLDKILDIEMDLQAGKRLEGSLYSSRRQGRLLPTRAQVNQQVEEKFREVIRPYDENVTKDENGTKKEELLAQLLSDIPFSPFERSYYTEPKIKHFLWLKWREETKEQLTKAYVRQAKAEVFRFFVEQKLAQSGNSRDDFGPARVREKYQEFRHRYEDFVRLENSAKDPTDLGLTPEKLEAFFNANPALQILIQTPKVKIQKVAFGFPSLEAYQEKDPLHFEEAKAKVASFYQEVLSQDFLAILKTESLSIFDLKSEPLLQSGVSDPSKKEDSQNYADQAESDINRQKEALAQALVQFPQVTPEKVQEFLDFYFKTIQDILSQEKSQHAAPMEAFMMAAEEAKGRYAALESSQEDLVLRDAALAFMEFCDRIMLVILKDRIFAHLELRKDQWETEKEFSYPAEVSAQEEWIERGGRYEVPEIEFISFYGKHPKKEGDQEVYYSRHSLNPALQVYQWLETQADRFLEFDFARLQEALYAEQQLKWRPSLEQELLKKYLPYLKLYSTEDFSLKLEDLGL